MPHTHGEKREKKAVSLKDVLDEVPNFRINIASDPDLHVNTFQHPVWRGGKNTDRARDEHQRTVLSSPAPRPAAGAGAEGDRILPETSFSLEEMTNRQTGYSNLGTWQTLSQK